MRLPSPRKITLFGALAITSLPFIASAQLSTAIIGYWPLDNDATPFADESPTGADGTFVSTANAAAFLPGQFGDAIDLDSTDAQYILIDGVPASTFDMGTGSGGTGEISISLWCDTAGFTTNWQALVAKGEGTDWRVARSGGSNNLAYAGGSGDVTNNLANFIDPPDVGTLHHVVAVTHATLGTRLYVDGTMVENTATPNLGRQNGLQMMIGNNPQNTARSWNGAIDDVIIFNRALTQTEVELIYNGGTGVSGAALLNPDDMDGDGMPDIYEDANGLDKTVDDTGLDLDEDGLTNGEEFTLGTKPNDNDTDDDGLLDLEETILGTDGYITDPTVADADGDGLNDGGEAAAMTDPHDPDSDDDGVNDNDDTAPNDPTNDNDGDGISNLDETNGTRNPWTGGSTTGGAPGEATDPLKADTDNDGINDGEEVNFPSDGDGFLTDPNNDDTDGDGFADGQEVALGSIPTNDGIQPSPWYAGLIGYWKFDGDTTDSSPTGADGTFTSNVATSPGADPVYDTAWFDDGIDLTPDNGLLPGEADREIWAQRVVIDSVHEDTFDSPGGDLTVSAWFRVDAFDVNWQGLIAKGEDASWRLARRGDANVMACNPGEWKGGGDDLPTTVLGPDVNDGQFHHMAAVTDADGNAQLWVDGELVEESTAPAVLNNNDLTMIIGGNPGAPATGDWPFRTWNGVLDDVAIWKRALTPDEISLIWNLGDGTSIQELIDSLDSDEDGLLDQVETNDGNYIDALATGSDPNNPDTNGDGVLDGVEVANDNDPSAVGNDYDLDGLTNLQETTGSENVWLEGVNTGGATAGDPTDPLIMDSDSDGLDDGAEIAAGTDPNNSDTDGDGWSDGAEITEGTDPLDGMDFKSIDSGLVGYWPLDGNARDFSGTGADGTFNGTAAETFATGRFGQAASLDGTDQFYAIDTVPSDTFDFGVAGGGTGSVTISAWFQTGPFSTGWQALVAKGEGVDWRVARYSAGGSSGNQIGYAGGIGDIGGLGPDVNTTPGPGDLIHHVVAITEAGVGTRLYVDGALVDTNPAAPNIGEQEPDVYMRIGSNPDNGRFWKGLIDDVAIWDRPLQDSEVTKIWNGGTGASIATLAGIDITTPDTGGVTIDAYGFNATTGDVELSASGLDAAATYQLRRSILLDGTDWVDVGASFTGGTTNTFLDPDPVGPTAFYQIFDVSP